MTSIVFDLDGTLIDSAPDIHAAANRMLSAEGLAPLDLETVTSFIGNGIPNLVSLVMQARGISPDRHSMMVEHMLDHYTARPTELTRPYPGVPQALERLRGAGHRLGVCTNKFKAPAVQILNALDLGQFFDVVIGGDSLSVRKPDPAPLRLAFERLGDGIHAYVGDSEVDAETAQAAGVAFALFTEGYRKSPVDAMPHTLLFRDFHDLPEIMQRFKGEA